MANDSDHIIFSSIAFPKVPGEDEATNPGVFGTSLAKWLAAELKDEFQVGDQIIPEGFGWLVDVKAPHGSVYVVCTSTDENADEWRVFAFVEGGLLRKLMGRQVPDAVRDAVFEFVRGKIAQHPGTTALEIDR